MTKQLRLQNLYLAVIWLVAMWAFISLLFTSPHHNHAAALQYRPAFESAPAPAEAPPAEA